MTDTTPNPDKFVWDEPMPRPVGETVSVAFTGPELRTVVAALATFRYTQTGADLHSRLQYLYRHHFAEDVG